MKIATEFKLFPTVICIPIGFIYKKKKTNDFF